MLILVLLVISLLPLAAQVSSESEKAAAALRILDAWHAKSPKEEERFLRFVLWTPKGREAPADYQARLDRMMRHIQKFYANEMNRLGFGSRSINLPMNKDGSLKIHLIEGLHPEANYGMSSGNEIKKECLAPLREKGIDASKETLVIFCNLAKWDAEKLIFSHNSPYYAGGNNQGGTAWQLDSPELDPKNLVLREPIISDGQYGRISLGKHNSIFIGGVCHELGHALGLPHCKERPDEAARGTALMGSGNRTYGDELRGEGKGSFLTLAHALRLASHPQFSGSTKGMNLPVKAEVSNLEITTKEKSIYISGTLTADPPVYAVVAYFDPAGGGDYNATTETAVPDESGNFILSTDALAPGKTGELRLIPLHVNGSTGGWMSQTKFRYPYSISKDGMPNLQTFHTKEALAPIIDALRIQDGRRAAALAHRLTDPFQKEIAQNLLRSRTLATKTPAETVQGNGPLTRFKPTKVKVGWGRPTYDRLPGSSPLIESGGQLFSTGIYAHAPSTYDYDLGGSWKTLTGTVGLAAGKGGSVQFIIQGDDKVLWQSKTVKEGILRTFEVDLTGVKTLKLLTDPTQDGPSQDWSLWLAPKLIR